VPKMCLTFRGKSLYPLGNPALLCGPIMNKLYQVFVSSTYRDLLVERRAVFQALMAMSCMPAGMEWFPAETEEQWKVIRRVIEGCDFYVLILGGRYGTTTVDGLSYTEKEFDFAVGKMPVLVFCHEDPSSIPLSKSETDSKLKERLDSFRKKAMTGRIVKFWTTPDNLAVHVSTAVSNAMETQQAVGWVRGTRTTLKEQQASERVRKSGIVDIKMGRYRDEILPTFAAAQESIWICKTWIPKGDLDDVKEGLRKAITKNQNIQVKILCLDPASPLAVQRFHDSRAPEEHKTLGEGDGGKMISEGLNQVINLCKEGVGGKRKLYQQVEIKVYRNLPALSLYANEKTALIGWYWMGTESFDGPVLEVAGKKPALSAYARENFKQMWMRASDYVREIEGASVLNRPMICPSEVLEQLDVKRRPGELKKLLNKWPELREYGQEILRFIKTQGYCVVKGFPFSGYKSKAQKNLFLMLVSACGAPSDHKPGEEEYICKVTPRPDLNRPIATYSEHDREAPLHTDSHYRDTPEQFVAFLMEQQAPLGGRNILLKSSCVFAEMRDTEEGRRWLKYLKTKKIPSAVPSRYSGTPGDEPRFVEATIINDAETMIRFREDTIREGIRLCGNKDSEQEQALDFLRKLIYRSPERRGVTLANGEILFVNNYSVLHARTGFEGLSRVLLRVRFNEELDSMNETPSAEP
jgi:alpha-ketoglutarate-dependent taurine dioxygenase